jgi:hypothetical protein
LADVVRPVLEDLLSTALKDGAGQMDEKTQAQLIAETRARLEQMDEASQCELLKAVNADELNDTAVRKILLTAGGLTAFSTSVSLAGFSAYILAAQASAFIPMVSGPALVSTVAVLANPITVIGLSGVLGWWFISSTVNKVRAEVGVRVLALLALQGLTAGRGGVQTMLASFSCTPKLRPVGDLSGDVVDRYQAEWRLLAPAIGKKGRVIDPRVAELMQRSALDGEAAKSRLGRLLFPGKDGLHDTAIISALTLGDIVYSAASIDPTVIDIIGNRI